MVNFTVFKGSKEGKVIKSTSTRELKPDQVLIRVTHSGLCGTDQHYQDVDMALGHEGAGIIEELGSLVTTHQTGDSVGWSYQHDSCNHCKQCLTGRETLCPDRAMYGGADKDQGSFASHAVWKADYIYKIPDTIPREYAAPLMCGGATVFNVLRSVKATDVVGIIGVGGLGHLAIQFAAKMGCEVVVFSTTDSKKSEAAKLGAGEFIATKGLKELKVLRPIDHLLVTTSQQPDWKLYLPIVAPGGTVYPLTVSQGDLSIPYAFVNSKELRIQGSVVAARNVLREMLDFAAHHQIRPIIETFPMTVEGIEEGFQRLADGKMRYRGVLVAH